MKREYAAYPFDICLSVRLEVSGFLSCITELMNLVVGSPDAVCYFIFICIFYSFLHRI